MRGLFLKIFLWFWGAQILIGLALTLLTAATQRTYDEQLQSAVGASLEDRARAAAVVYEVGGLEALRQAWRLTPDRAVARRGGFGRPPAWGAATGPPDHSPSEGARFDDGPPPDAPPEDGSPGDGPHSGPRRQSASFYLLRRLRNGLTPVLLVGPPIALGAESLLTQAQPNGATQTWRGADETVLARGVQTARGARYVAVISLRSESGRSFLQGYFRFGPGPGGPLRWLVVALTMGAVCFALARYITDPAIKLRRATRQFAAGDLSARVGPQIGRRRDELADLGRDFDLMAERIEMLRLSERRLLGDISHELRSPLTRLKLALDLAEQSADAQTKTYLTRIEAEAEELNALIGQLLTLTRLESAAGLQNTRANEKYPVDLGEIVAHVGHNADFEARARGGAVEITQNCECILEGKGELLHSALENVVRNAILHSPHQPRVEVSLAVEAGHTALIRVRDFGPGVPPEALPLLFQPFYRVAQARERQSGGTGLGLSITQRAVEFHGGSVAAFNAEGGGLLVEIRLPVGGVVLATDEHR